MTSRKVVIETSWAVLAVVETEALAELARKYVPREVPWAVLPGTKGAHGLVVGRSAPDDRVAVDLAKRGVVAYLLDFNDDAWSIVEYKGRAARHKRGHPAAFLKARGITAPGFEPVAPSPLRFAHVVEGVTIDQARTAYSNDNLSFHAHVRGTLVVGDPFLNVRRWLNLKQGRVFRLVRHPETGQFWCDVLTVDDPRHDRYLTEPMANADSYRVVDNILGAKTPIEICRVLEVPPSTLGLSGDGETD